MAVRIRLKRMGRTHRPFFRVCAMDSRVPRDGKVIEELGHYDPMVRETDARAVLKSERIDYWLGTGAKPTEKVAVLIKKYGTNGTHLDQQQAAFDRLQIKPVAPPAEEIDFTVDEPAAAPEAEAPAEEAATEEASAEVKEEAAAEEKPAEEEKSE